MLGLLLAIGSSFLIEVSDSIAKKKIQARQVSIYTTGFLVSVFGLLILVFSGFSRNTFHFSYASLPTLGFRVILEIILSWITIIALAKSNRSTFSFVRTITIPLLLTVDIIVGYSFLVSQIIGIIIISGTVAFFILASGKLEKRGLGLVLLSALLPVATLSLYKYDINHFNSVESEQIIVSIALLSFFLLMAVFKAKENPFAYLIKPVFLLQSIVVGFAGVIGSFAYVFLSPSVVVAILRASAVLFATLSGNLFFREKKLYQKIVACLVIIVGLCLIGGK